MAKSPIPDNCAFKGCPKTTADPINDGWPYFTGWGPRFADGYYCKPHADALEALHVSGELHGDDDDDNGV